MANGDKAAAVGWTTYAQTQDRRLGYDNDNYVLDRVAEQFVTLRDTVLPAINQPMFAVRRGTAIYNLAGGEWTPITSSPFAEPTINTGFGTATSNGWRAGELIIRYPGMYQVRAHLQFVDANYNRLALEIVKNTSSAGTNNTLARNVTGGGGLSVDVLDTVRLVAGDVVRLLGYQRETGGASHGVDTGPADISFGVEWVRA